MGSRVGRLWWVLREPTGWRYLPQSALLFARLWLGNESTWHDYPSVPAVVRGLSPTRASLKAAGFAYYLSTGIRDVVARLRANTGARSIRFSIASAYAAPMAL